MSATQVVARNGPDRADEADEAFQKAEDLRKEILAGHLRVAYDGIEMFKRQIDPARTKPPIQSVEDLQTDATVLKGGFTSHRSIDCINALYTILNDK